MHCHARQKTHTTRHHHANDKAPMQHSERKGRDEDKKQEEGTGKKGRRKDKTNAHSTFTFLRKRRQGAITWMHGSMDRRLPAVSCLIFFILPVLRYFAYSRSLVTLKHRHLERRKHNCPFSLRKEPFDPPADKSIRILTAGQSELLFQVRTP
mmetsp:Transcript_2718/g.5612  ORF Transcript_2718/g.5612 Transcript_2718/m.5612 type:complete len:152 (-) Transcript_2718:522-977(-)